jgi:glycosyltransferase involved in cell wall biosynthesis
MIVKNESKIIERFLSSVAPWIDSYCICDTGSTDNTIEIIRTFFEKANLPGKIVQEPFRNFGYNRSFALKECESIETGADYILLLDADMVFQVAPNITKEQFCQSLTKSDSFCIFQGTESFIYKNVRIVKNRSNMTYIGVTHEYVNIEPSGKPSGLIDKKEIFIKDIGDGGSKQDKFLRDIRLLTEGIIDEPQHIIRYTFYLANSYRDSGQPELAIETYKKRVALRGWFEEVWQSHYNIGNLYFKMGDHANAIFHWLEAYQVHTDRVENLYQIISFYRLQCKYQLAYSFYNMAKRQLLNLQEKGSTPDYLFVQKDLYDYKVDYEMSIIGYYCNPHQYDLPRICMDVIAYPHLEEHLLKNVLSNYKFYAASLLQYSVSDSRIVKSIDLGSKQPVPQMIDDTFISSSPSLIAMSNNRLAVCTRYVNYRINDKGGYILQGNITTQNLLTILTLSEDPSDYSIEHQSVIQYDALFDAKYVGIEDMRIFSPNGVNLYYYGTRGMPDGSIQIEMGQIDVASSSESNTLDSCHPRIPGQGQVEKNWVNFFNPITQELKTIYGWGPLIIGSIVKDLSTDVKDLSTDVKDLSTGVKDLSTDVKDSSTGVKDLSTGVKDSSTGVKDSSSIPMFQKTHEIATPQFFRHVRGSGNGIVIGDEIWFVCHIVSDESRRYYYHLMVVLDLSTYQVKGYTPMFTFEKKPIEYTLGFIYLAESKTMVFGYSLLDRETKYMEIEKSWFDDSMILV